MRFAVKRLVKNLFNEFCIDITARSRGDAKFVFQELKENYKRKIDYSCDVHLVFFCGIGDALYGLNTFLNIREKCRIAGVSFFAHCSSGTSRMANSTLASFLKQLSIFDDVFLFPGAETEYWKYFDWRTATYGHDGEKFYPFIYSTSPKINRRWLGIAKNFKEAECLDGSWDRLFNLTELEKQLLKIDQSEKFLYDWINLDDRQLVLCHFESRSAHYTYKYGSELCSKLIADGKRVLLVCDDKSTVYSIEESSKFLKISSSQIQLLNLMYILKKYKFDICAVNSVFWPVSEILNLNTLALHFLKSEDGHHFYHNKMFMITTELTVAKKINLSHGNAFFLTRKMYDNDDKHHYAVHIKPNFVEIYNDCKH